MTEEPKVCKIMEAEEKKLVMAFRWLPEKLLGWLESEYRRIKQNPRREVMLVRFKGKYSVFVDDLSER